MMIFIKALVYHGKGRKEVVKSFVALNVPAALHFPSENILLHIPNFVGHMLPVERAEWEGVFVCCISHDCVDVTGGRKVIIGKTGKKPQHGLIVSHHSTEPPEGTNFPLIVAGCVVSSPKTR